MIGALTQKFRRLHTTVTRATMVPLLIRVGLFAAFLAAMGFAFPPALFFGRTVAALVVVAVLPALAPRGVTTTLLIVAIVVGWVIVTAEAVEGIQLWRLLGLSATLYLAHTLAALAAVLPSDALVATEVLARWVARAAAVVLAAAVCGVLLVSIAGIGGDTSLTLAALGGLVVAVTIAAVLGWLVKRRA
ncbi:hypothetical protein Ais01nite_40210 [Asanoa ishikariensis]|uniref:Uncharacterized protein n=1 Tax=Asanoa ishikariensis TaxID=137265 RepID=A0A1H3M8T1_9ACTN|nr:hypothetical protein [Asanoa ishikariensis]GIF65986.1 hypothetical protein Ais01nite_40210 [Asanoa ishikariensis]SDY73101.1 hypothetical protein SAMN05421684_1257 [Asanoa ishikariensis]